MKKFLSFLTSALLLVAVALSGVGCLTPREEILKIYNVGEYMDETIYEDFEQWYFEQTGKTVKVKPSEFLTNEEMLTEIEYGHADYDLVCPSDYTVERMIKSGLLKKVDKSIVNVEGIVKEQYLNVARVFDPTLEYAVPYMYGTFGLLYDYSKTGEHVTGWDAIFTNKYGTKVASQKKSMRDAYASACIYNNRDELLRLAQESGYGEAYQAKLQAIFEDSSDATLDAAHATLTAQKKVIAKWDEENVKFEMSAGSSRIQVSLMWSCDAGYVMNDYEDNNGNEQQGNRNLWYAIPLEGGNVYMDNFVIPKFARNEEAANYFLAFLCQKEIAIRNSEYIGAVSPVSEAYDELKAEYEADESLYEGGAEGWRDMYLDMLFPSENTLARCGVMRDFGAREAKVATMWSRIV